MTGRLLQIIFGVLVFFSSTPAGMAKDAVLEEARADFFVAAQAGEDSERQALQAFQDALQPEAWSESPSEDSVSHGKHQKRVVKRTASHRFSARLTRFSPSLFRKAWAKGVARHPRTQDAQQERTQMIRFLHLAATINC